MSVIFTKTLYINHSTGQLGSWSVSVTDNGDDTATLTTSALKVLGGKPVVNSTIVSEGKNIGRANETTPIEQALLEAESKANKKKDKGYTEEKPEAGQQSTNGLGLVKPMLATELNKVKSIDYPVFVQPKLDGNRCLAARIDGSVRLWSRGGKFINLPHIAEALDDILEDGDIFDGELYVHGETLQTITSWIKKLKPESVNIQYFVYDLVLESDTYQERLARLETLIPDDHPHIALCDTQIAHDEESMMVWHSRWVDDGFEGAIVRTDDTGYQTRRSKSLIKVKSFQDAEFPVLDVIQGKSRIVNGEQLETAIYVCETEHGKRFNVTAHGTMHDKHFAWVHRERVIGKQLTVKFFNLTPDGLPFLPVSLRFREDI